MKTGKGGKGTAAPKAAPKPAPTKAAPPPKDEAPPKSPKKKSILDDDDDDPFADKIDDDDPFAAAAREAEASKANAIVMTPKKTKTNTSELKCPMCDTVGFVPDKSGGKDVKCYNPSCKAPIFMAPKNLAPPVQITTAKPKPEKKAGGPGIKPLYLAIGGGIALVGVVAAIVFFWPEPKAEKSPWGAGTGKTGVTQPNPDPKNVIVGNDNQQEANAKVVPDVQKLDVAGLLVLMHDLGQSEKLANKKYCRQRTAIGYALTDNVDGMKTQFQAMDDIEIALQHFKIPAYLTMGWKQLAKGDKARAALTADDAVKATANIGKGSRDTQESVIDLAAFLVANGKAEVAKKILSDNLRADESTPLVVALLLARHRGDFDIDQELPGESSNPTYALPEAAATLVLTTRGFWDEAQQWATSIADEEAKTDCVITWADAKLRDALSRKQATEPASEAIAASAKLPPGAQAQLLARLALTHAKAGNQAEAERLIAAAQAALKSIPLPPPSIISDFKQVLDWKAPEAMPLRQATLASAGIGLAQARLKKLDAGSASIAQGLKYARGIAPSPNATTALKAEAEGVDIDVLRNRMRKELNLPTRDAAERKTREMMAKLTEIEKRARARFELQEAILLRPISHGLAKQVWTEILDHSQRTDPNDSEPYLSGKVPPRLIAHFDNEGLAEDAKHVLDRAGDSLFVDDNTELQEVVDHALRNNDFEAAITKFNEKKLAGGSEEIALRGLMRQAKREGQALAALSLSAKLDTRSNQFVKYEAIRLLAAYAARKNDADKVRTAVNAPGVPSLEKISGFLGLLEGDLSKTQPKPAGEKAIAEKAAAEEAKKGAK